MVQCTDIRKLTDPYAVCEFAKKYCALDSLVPYAKLVFCYLRSQTLRILLLSAGILLTSGSTGIAAFDYLSPNLTHVAEESALPQSLMGVTVLAFGNGSVDVFGAFVALQSGQGAMAVGEILGGAFFVVTVVVGSMAIISPFRVQTSVIHDIFVLQLITLYTLCIVISGQVTFAKAVVGVLAYVLYSAFVVHSQLKKSKIELGLSPIPPIEENYGGLLSPALSDCTLPASNTFAAVRPSLYSAVDMNWRARQRLASIADHSDVFVPRAPLPCHTPIENPSQHPEERAGHMRRRSSAPEVMTVSAHSPFSSELPVPSLVTPSTPSTPRDIPKLRIDTDLGDPVTPCRSHRSAFPYTHLSRTGSYQHHHASKPTYSLKSIISELLDQQELETRFNSPYLEHQEFPGLLQVPPRDEINWSDSDTAGVSSQTELVESVEVCERSPLFSALCPVLAKWREQTWVHRIVMFPMLPVLTLLAWSVPLSINASSRLHLCIHSIAVPLVLPLLLQVHPNVSIMVLQALAAVSGVVWWGLLRRPCPGGMSVAAIGFFMGMLWVVLLATEFVSQLTVLAEVCKVSNALMGLTVFALGDSMGDFVSNITVAQIGYAEMAVAACFGGPIFTLLMGVCGASLMVMLLNKTTVLELEPHFSLNSSAMAILVTLTLVQQLLFLNGNKLGKRSGCALIAVWAAYTAFSVFLFR